MLNELNDILDKITLSIEEGCGGKKKSDKKKKKQVEGKECDMKCDTCGVEVDSADLEEDGKCPECGGELSTMDED